MTKKRFTLSQNKTFHTVIDTVKNKPLGVFEFKDDEFPAYACFHMIIDLMNDLHEKNQALQRHIEKNTLSKMRVEDVFDWAKYDKFYDNEEAIKSIDWVAKELGVDLND